MATKKISELTELTTIASDDILPIVDTSENETKSISLGNFIDKTIATQAEAKAGTDNTKLMTPLRTKQAIDKIESWQTPTLLNSWINFDDAFEHAGFYKKNNRVYLKGLIKSGVMQESAFNLPVGYIPTYNEAFGTVSNGAFGAVFIMSDGRVIPNIGDNTYVSLSGISFRVN